MEGAAISLQHILNRVYHITATVARVSGENPAPSAIVGQRGNFSRERMECIVVPAVRVDGREGVEEKGLGWDRADGGGALQPMRISAVLDCTRNGGSE